MKDSEDKDSGFSHTGLGLADQVISDEGDWDGFFLNYLESKFQFPG